MEDRGISLTSEQTNISNTGSIADIVVEPRVNKSIALIAVLLSVCALTGAPATTLNASTSGFNKVENMVSITQSENIENELKQQDYSFITAMGFEEDSVSFPDIFS